MVYVGIRDGKIWDICDPLKNKRVVEDGVALTPEELSAIQYIKTALEDIVVGDTWVSTSNTNLHDSPKRSEEPPPDAIEILQGQVSDLQDQVTTLEARVSALEAQLLATIKKDS